MGQNDGGETAWSYGKRSDVYYQSVPCRHHIKRLSAGDLRGNAEMENIVPAIMPTKRGHDAFLRSGMKLRFQA